MKKIRIKHDKLLLAFLIIILIFCIFCYSYIFYCSYSRNEFVKQAIKISTENQNSVFRVNRILLYSSGNAIDNSSNQSLQDLGICQYTDIAISIDNTSYISDLNSTNTVKELYIDNINISTNLEDGFRYLNYKNLNNFGKFELLNTPENGRIIIGARQTDDNYIEMYVRDFGKGIDPRYHQSIFDHYFRVPGTKVQGSGLGLSISKDFVEAHGGSLTVDSEIGKGSCFTLRLKA